MSYKHIGLVAKLFFKNRFSTKISYFSKNEKNNRIAKPAWSGWFWIIKLNLLFYLKPASRFVPVKLCFIDGDNMSPVEFVFVEYSRVGDMSFHIIF